MLTTINNLPPQIKQYFSPNLLMSYLERMMNDVLTEILPQAKKKFRPQDIGRRREFNILLSEFYQLYERKKAEEKAFKDEIKAKIKDRPHISDSGGTITFKRIPTKK